MNRILITLFTFSCAVLTLNAQDNLSALIPMPNHIEQAKGKPYRFVEGHTAITIADEEYRFAAKTLADIIEHRTGVSVPIMVNNA